MIADTTSQIIATAFRMGRVLRSTMGNLRHDDMHIGQIHALAFIKANKDITMKELSRMLLVTQPSVTTFVDRLESMGLVRRYHDAGNRRLVRLSVTSQGVRLLRKKMAEKKLAVEKLLLALTPVEQRTLLTLLRKMVDHCSGA